MSEKSIIDTLCETDGYRAAWCPDNGLLTAIDDGGGERRMLAELYVPAYKLANDMYGTRLPELVEDLFLDSTYSENECSFDVDFSPVYEAADGNGGLTLSDDATRIDSLSDGPLCVIEAGENLKGKLMSTARLREGCPAAVEAAAKDAAAKSAEVGSLGSAAKNKL